MRNSFSALWSHVIPWDDVSSLYHRHCRSGNIALCILGIYSHDLKYKTKGVTNQKFHENLSTSSIPLELEL